MAGEHRYDFTSRRNKALELMKGLHEGQYRNNGKVPVWRHLDRVSRLLEEVLDQPGYGDDHGREAIIIAGLGHDCLEDTKVTVEGLRDCFNRDEIDLIEGMTNRWGDNNVGPYVDHVVASPEGVRLIKLADLYDNLTSVLYGLHDLGPCWTRTKFLPVVEPMIKALFPTASDEYRVAGGQLRQMVKLSYGMLLGEIDSYGSVGK